MGLISRLYSFASGDTICSSEINAEFNQILNLNNDNLDSIAKRVHILEQDNKLLSFGIANASRRLREFEHKYEKLKKDFE